MFRNVVFAYLIFFSSTIVYAKDPIYTTEKLPDGKLVITCPTEDDALILLNDYNLPDKFGLIVLLKGIIFEDPEFNKIATIKTYPLKGTKITNAKAYGYRNGLNVINTQFFKVDRNREYYVIFDVELNPYVLRGRQLGIDTTDFDKYAAMILGITDKNFNPVN